jgi:cytoskeletal protein CcmA (bactofilin family)
MKMVENFKQALREIFMPKKAREESKQDVSAQETAKAQAIEVSVQEPEEAAAPQNAEEKQQEKNKAARQPVSADSEAAETKAAGQAANIITKDTRIVGTITTDSKLVVEGEVEGGIDSKNIVVVSGVVCGDIRCNSAEINNARVEGNIEVIDRLQKCEQTVKSIPCQLHGNMLFLQHNAMLIIINIWGVLEMPGFSMQSQGYGPVGLTGRMVDPPCIAYVFRTKKAFGISGLRSIP